MYSIVTRLFVAAGLLGLGQGLAAERASPASTNLLGNASFEDGREMWHMDRAGKTTAQFTVDDKDAADGRRSALLSIDTADDWGVQFGQTLDGGTPGQTFTLAVLAKSVKEPVTFRLEVEPRQALGPRRRQPAVDRDQRRLEGVPRHVSRGQAVPRRLVCLRQLPAGGREPEVGCLPPVCRRVRLVRPGRGAEAGGGRSQPVRHGQGVAWRTGRHGARGASRLDEAAGRRNRAHVPR
jgi:hypothetical protein